MRIIHFQYKETGCCTSDNVKRQGNSTTTKTVFHLEPRIQQTGADSAHSVSLSTVLSLIIGIPGEI
jgi:hypothetical protein